MNFKIICNQKAFECWLSAGPHGEWKFKNGGRAWKKQDEVGWWIPTRTSIWAGVLR